MVMSLCFGNYLFFFLIVVNAREMRRDENFKNNFQSWHFAVSVACSAAPVVQRLQRLTGAPELPKASTAQSRDLSEGFQTSLQNTQ